MDNLITFDAINERAASSGGQIQQLNSKYDARDGMNSCNAATVNFLISVLHFNPNLLPRLLLGGWVGTVGTDRVLVTKVALVPSSVSQSVARERVYYQTLVAH